MLLEPLTHRLVVDLQHTPGKDNGQEHDSQINGNVNPHGRTLLVGGYGAGTGKHDNWEYQQDANSLIDTVQDAGESRLCHPELDAQPEHGPFPGTVGTLP